MDKSIVFFSHSSKDSVAISEIKSRIISITGGNVEVFVSSDGQSIPLGRNWVHKIEEALKRSKLMFIFVTPNSIQSNWIYFEAGFAYSKGIKVVPVGLGVDIGTLKAPLSLLQGFNVNSADSLNNITSVINTEFNQNYLQTFTIKDYNAISTLSIGTTNDTIADFYDSAYFTIYSEYRDENHTLVSEYDVNDIFEKFIEYLDQNKIPFGLNNTYDRNASRCILTRGSKIKLIRGTKQNDTGTTHPDMLRRIEVDFSMLNFALTFEILDKLLTLAEGLQYISLTVKPNSDYSLITESEKLSSILQKYEHIIKPSTTQIGYFYYRDNSLAFYTYSDAYDIANPDRLAIDMRTIDSSAINVIDLLMVLIESEIIN